MSKHIAELLAEYAHSTGARSLHLQPGIWQSKIDDTWTVKINPHPEKIENMDPLCWYIEYNGWPAGVISVMGDGVLCAGEGGNEANLRKAIIANMTKN